MKTIKVVLLTLVLLPFLFIGCDDTGSNVESVYKFSVISTGNGFHGYYYVDGDKYNISSSDIVLDTDSYYYTYEKDLSPLNHFNITVDGYPELKDALGVITQQSTNSLHIQFFDNGECVEETTKTKTVDDVQLQGILKWDYTEEDTTDTTDTSSSSGS